MNNQCLAELSGVPVMALAGAALVFSALALRQLGRMT
jgi:hypothetical protein